MDIREFEGGFVAGNKIYSVPRECCVVNPLYAGSLHAFCLHISLISFLAEHPLCMYDCKQKVKVAMLNNSS